MRRRLKRTTKQYIVVSFISIIIIGGAFATIFLTATNQIKTKYQKEIRYLSEQLDTRKVYVYEAKTDISAGSRITKDKLNYIQTYSNQTQEYYMTKDCIGMVSLIDISKGTQLLKGMLTVNDVENNLREVEYNSFYINSNMDENDVADIRILFPNGEDYIVLSKKRIKNLSLEKDNCFLWLTEEEILNMSGAIVDAYLYSGTRLYTAKYIEPNLQKASIVTYQPSLSSLLLMEQDENIADKASKELNKQLRQDLEKRLATEAITIDSERALTPPVVSDSTNEYFNDGISQNSTYDTEEFYSKEEEDSTGKYQRKEGTVEYGG